MLRLNAVCERLGCCKSTLYERVIRPGRLKVYQIGARSVGVRPRPDRKAVRRLLLVAISSWWVYLVDSVGIEYPGRNSTPRTCL
jgi:hypothetical protein